MLKYWAQLPVLMLLVRSIYVMNPIQAALDLALLMFIRYYSAVRYPQVKRFESYYVEKLAVSQCFSKVQLTWAMPKQPKVFVVPTEKFKQIHFLNHKTEPDLSDNLIPFHVMEQGFDDNTFELLYRPIYLQVMSEQQ